MDDLVKRLETEVPSRELDAAIWYYIDPDGYAKCEQALHCVYDNMDQPDLNHIITRDEWINSLIPENCEPYTTSLDAALPWERIIKTAYSPNKMSPNHDWCAVHEGADTHRQTVGFAKTEAMARRIAALKARQGYPIQGENR